MQNKSRYHPVKVLRLRAKAEGHRVSLASIGQAANVAAATISKIEEGQIKKPKPQILDQIAEYFATIFNESITSNDLIDPAYVDPEYEETLRQYLQQDSLTAVQELAARQSQVGDDDPLRRLIQQFPPNQAGSGDAVQWLAQQKTKMGPLLPVQTKVDILAPPQLAYIPVLKDVPSGNLDQVTEEHVIQRILFPVAYLSGAKFALYAVGHSMAPDIKNGDLLFIDPTVQPKEGDTVIAEIGGQITCKIMRTFDGQLLLMPANSDFPPIVVTAETTANIMGKVVKHLRDYQ